jgi:TonB family protein
MSFNYRFNFEPVLIDTPPQMGGLDIPFPDSARKNGVEGTVKVDFTMGEDGKVRDIVIVQDLPFGVGDSVKQALGKFYFKPALASGKPVAMKVHMDYVVVMAYSEDDKNVSKPQITERPDAVYPPKYLAEKVKGKVSVGVMFYVDGTVKVIETSSVMPQEFDKSAAEAAAKIKFSPAVHKKSKKPVAQRMEVIYEFKP